MTWTGLRLDMTPPFTGENQTDRGLIHAIDMSKNILGYTVYRSHFSYIDDVYIFELCLTMSSAFSGTVLTDHICKVVGVTSDEKVSIKRANYPANSDLCDGIVLDTQSIIARVTGFLRKRQPSPDQIFKYEAMCVDPVPGPTADAKIPVSLSIRYPLPYPTIVGYSESFVESFDCRSCLHLVASCAYDMSILRRGDLL